MTRADMERFWDEAARENAPYFVDNELDYSRADMEQFWARGPAAVDGILEQLGIALSPEDEVVEVGCGIGRLTRVLAERSRRVWAFDVSSEMLRRAREANREAVNVEWIHGDGVSLRPLPDGVASVCFSHVVFQHIPDPSVTVGYVREMGRVLRPGGWSAFQVSTDPDVHGGLRGARSLAHRAKAVLGRAPRGQDDPSWLGSAIDLDSLLAVAHRAGLASEAVHGAGTQFCLVLLRRQ